MRNPRPGEFVFMLNGDISIIESWESRWEGNSGPPEYRYQSDGDRWIIITTFSSRPKLVARGPLGDTWREVTP